MLQRFYEYPAILLLLSSVLINLIACYGILDDASTERRYLGVAWVAALCLSIPWCCWNWLIRERCRLVACLLWSILGTVLGWGLGIAGAMLLNRPEVEANEGAALVLMNVPFQFVIGLAELSSSCIYAKRLYYYKGSRLQVQDIGGREARPLIPNNQPREGAPDQQREREEAAQQREREEAAQQREGAPDQQREPAEPLYQVPGDDLLPPEEEKHDISEEDDSDGPENSLENPVPQSPPESPGRLVTSSAIDLNMQFQRSADRTEPSEFQEVAVQGDGKHIHNRVANPKERFTSIGAPESAESAEPVEKNYGVELRTDHCSSHSSPGMVRDKYH